MILNPAERNEPATDVLEIGIGKFGKVVFIIAPLACLLWGVFMNPQTSLDQATRWCFIIGGAILSILALYVIKFPPSSVYTYLDSEGFNLGTGEKIPWEDVLSIQKHEFRVKKSARHFVNVTLKDSSQFKTKKKTSKKASELIFGKSDISFEVQFFHDINWIQLHQEMVTRWNAKTSNRDSDIEFQINTE